MCMRNYDYCYICTLTVKGKLPDTVESGMGRIFVNNHFTAPNNHYVFLISSAYFVPANNVTSHI
jgi:hypothetical protein